MIVLVMGVSGSGKSTLGRALARSLDWEFIEADAFHTASNIEKMRAAIALTEADRQPWLQRLRHTMLATACDGRDAVVACSALAKRHRDRLSQDLPDIRFVFLNGDPKLIAERLRSRQHAFMSAKLLDSQLATLEVPAEAIHIQIRHSTRDQVERVRRELGLDQP